MKFSPLRTLFLGTLVIFSLGLILDLVHNQIIQGEIGTFHYVEKLSLARFYWSTGQIDKAIIEYARDIAIEDLEISEQANQELLQLLADENTSLGKLKGEIIYLTWTIPPKLFGFGIILIAVWLLLGVMRFIIRKPLIAIIKIQNISNLAIGDNFPQLIYDRLGEISWRLNSIKNSTNLMTESVDLPIMGMIGENATVDTVALVETALMLSGNSGSFPVSRLLDSIKLWIEQPKFLVRGHIRKASEEFLIQINLIDRKNYTISNSWNLGIKNDDRSDIILDIIDSFIYPLLFRFGKNIGTNRWEAFKYLNYGLQEFHLFYEQIHNEKRIGKAKDNLVKALAYDPDYALAKFNMGLLLLRNGEFESAKDMFHEITKSSFPENLRLLAQYHYGVSLFQMGQDWASERAIHIFNTIIDSSPETAKATYEIIYMTQSTLALAYARLASRTRENADKYVKLAVQNAEKVLEKKHVPGEIKANALAAIGLVHDFEKDYTTAISFFTDGVNQNSESLSCWIGLGESLLHAGQKENAINAFRKAEALSPSSGYPSYRLGNIYLEQGELEQARSAYQRGSSFALTHLALGKMALKDRDYEYALDEFRKASQLNKRLGEAWVNISWTIAEMETADPDLLSEAETCARRALQVENDPNQFWHRHSVLSRVLIIRGKLEIALREASEAVKGDPKRPQAYYYLALAEYNLKRYSKARSNLQKVVELGDEYWQVKAEFLIKEMEGKK